ncbi:CCCH and RING finger protein [Coniochaeta sp. PMI_546]|nr:CCCH and RING finger protein [Coniochaeta sp. PMI_546]
MTVAEPVATFKKRGAKAKANIRKREATPPPANDSDSSDFSSSEDETGHRVKRRKRNTAVVGASSKDTTSKRSDWGVGPAEVDRSIPITDSNDATKQSNWYEKDESGSKSIKIKPADGDRVGPDGTYKGLANQTSYIEKNPDRQSKTVGPVKAPTNIRTITVTDFAPDVCKDYKNTGFCGFGDACKFLHAREDYKQGWQLDKEWETVTKGKKNLGGTVVASADRSKKNEDDDDEDIPEEIPFACIICGGPYKSPIVTRCGHYFCEPCALQRYRRDPSCAACGSGTQGVFNAAKKLQKILEKKKGVSTKWKSSGFKPGTMEVKEDAEQVADEA